MLPTRPLPPWYSAPNAIRCAMNRIRPGPAVGKADIVSITVALARQGDSLSTRGSMSTAPHRCSQIESRGTAPTISAASSAPSRAGYLGGPACAHE